VPPFYPRASRAYASRLRKELDSGTDAPRAAARARGAACDAFGPGRELAESGNAQGAPCDLQDAELSLALGDALPWDEDGATADAEQMARFEATARAVFEPLDAHWDESHDHDASELAASACPEAP
jgi:hypothetical protein